MTKGIRFTDEFKQDAVAQTVERGYTVSELAERAHARSASELSGLASERCFLLEASTRIELVYTDLQSAASPLRQLAAMVEARPLGVV